MSVRTLDGNGDWIFGIGRNAYLTKNREIGQAIQTRLLSFVGDCFFDTEAGIDWFNLLGSKQQLSLNLAISAIILNTPNVIAMRQLFINLDRSTRLFSIQYQVQTVYSVLSGNVNQSIGV